MPCNLNILVTQMQSSAISVCAENVDLSLFQEYQIYEICNMRIAINHTSVAGWATMINSNCIIHALSLGIKS